jgi:hypothetical protein
VPDGRTRSISATSFQTSIKNRPFSPNNVFITCPKNYQKSIKQNSSYVLLFSRIHLQDKEYAALDAT